MPFKKYKRVMIFSGFMALYFLLSAMIVHILQSQIIEIILDYETICPTRGNICHLEFSVQERIEPPIIVYYEIRNLL
jgi:hydrogenase maturation factor